MQKIKLSALLLAFFLLVTSASAMSRDELRDAYQTVLNCRGADSPYAMLPDSSTCRDPGMLTEDAQAETLAELNFIRSVAGLDPVTIDPLYSLRAQNAAYLLSVNGEITHHPNQPDGMEADFYESARIGALCSNIAMLSRDDPQVLIDGVIYFARDDGDRNLENLSHRRWMLNPQMTATGFGLSASPDGSSYVAMYAVDTANTDADWDYIAWPCDGAFPVEMMRSGLAWSVSLNTDVYDLSASSVSLRLTELNSGKTFLFDADQECRDGFCRLNTDSCGCGPCLIFRPEIAAQGIDEYVQNQRWRVELEGLKTIAGEDALVAYESEMVSLYPQDAANVEISDLTLTLRPGEIFRLSAAVIPEYADDLSVSWTSNDPTVAVVDESGCVTAVSKGICQIRAASVNGRFDECEVTIKE